jgi:hypothetical protein
MQISRTQGQTGYYGRAEDTLHVRLVRFRDKLEHQAD